MEAAPIRKARPATIAAPISVDEILASGGPNSPIRPAPPEHIGASGDKAVSPKKQLNRVSLQPLPLDTPTTGGALTSEARKDKRLSLTFPIHPPDFPSTRPSPSSNSRPPSWYNSPVTSPEFLASPTEPPSFLTRLAAQERRVLELKDELRQAEEELQHLKKQWAKEEATKKRQDVRKVHQLQPLSTNLPSLDTLEDDDSDGSSEWMQKEMERRKALLNGIKTSNRKVFSGSKHTRTLSLLSPEHGHFHQPFPQPADVRRSLDLPRQPPLIRSSTTPDIAATVAETDEELSPAMGGLQKDVILKTGKQMVADMKEGFLTFFEDIRQATVGEEGVNGTQTRVTESGNKGRTAARSNSRTSTHRPGARASKRPQPVSHSSDNLINIGTSFWREHGMNESAEPKPAPKLTKPLVRTKGANSTPRGPRDLDDAWDTWDTPVSAKHAQSDSSSSSQSGPSTSSDALSTPNRRRGQSPAPSTDRTLTPRSSIDATEYEPATSKRDSIPWPALQKLTPTNLRRTASHLMSEWEKSLSPPAMDVDSDSVSIASSSLAYPVPSAPNSTGKEKKGE